MFEWNSKFCLREKYNWNLSLELVEVGGYDFSHPRQGPQKSPTLKRLLLGFEPEGPGLNRTGCIFQNFFEVLYLYCPSN
jgi:hypothetical protein